MELVFLKITFEAMSALLREKTNFLNRFFGLILSSIFIYEKTEIEVD